MTTDKPRLKIADTTVSDDHRSVKFEFYHADQFVGEGKDRRQAVRGEHTVKVAEFPSDMLLHCANLGFAALAGGLYRRIDDDSTDTPESIVAALEKAMIEGTWKPGRESLPKEPTPFVQALAELTETPTHVIEAQIKDNPTKWSRSYKATVAQDPRVAKRIAEIIKARAERDAAKARERAKGHTPTALNLGALFAEPEPASKPQDEDEAERDATE